MAPLKCLISYAYYQKYGPQRFRELFVEPPNVMLDSGGFSALTLGLDITVDGYASWLRDWAPVADCYANLDVIGDAEGTWRNQQQLEAMGFAPVPVFHVNEDWKWLHHYLDKGYGYIALGGMVPHAIRPRNLMPWILRAFQIAGDRAVFHGFGATSWEIISSFPWYSVDSSSWGSGFRYGALAIFDERLGHFARFSIGERDKVYQYAEQIRRYGVDPKVFVDRALYHRRYAARVAGATYQDAEAYLRRRFGPIARPNGGDGLNLRLVAGSSGQPGQKHNALVDASGLHLQLVDSNAQNLQAVGLHVRLADTVALNLTLAESAVAVGAQTKRLQRKAAKG